VAFDVTILNLILAGQFAQANAALAAGHPNAFLNTIGAAVSSVTPTVNLTTAPGGLLGAQITVELTDSTPGSESARIVVSVLRAGVMQPVFRVDSTGKTEVNGGSGWKGLRILD